ncbi:hypothetical protein QJQ45_002525 [Haematococcus lacustris]|nr:hypothetical protein QJQ45_002525 [Haematococcus lacustris]
MRPSITKSFEAMPMFDQKRDDKHWDDECLTLLCSFAPDSVKQLCTLGQKLSVKMLNEYCKAVGLCVPANTLRADLRYMCRQPCKPLVSHAPQRPSSPITHDFHSSIIVNFCALSHKHSGKRTVDDILNSEDPDDPAATAEPAPRAERPALRAERRYTPIPIPHFAEVPPQASARPPPRKERGFLPPRKERGTSSTAAPPPAPPQPRHHPNRQIDQDCRAASNTSKPLTNYTPSTE